MHDLKQLGERMTLAEYKRVAIWLVPSLIWLYLLAVVALGWPQ